MIGMVTQMDQIGDAGDQDPDDEPLEPWSAPDGGPPRQWTHPSEAGLQVRVQTDRRRGRRLALSLLAIGTGVLLGTALVATLLRSDETAASSETDRAPLHNCLAMVDVVSEGEELQVTGLLVDDGRHVLVVGEDLRGAERIAVRIGGSRTGAELVAMDPYADLSLLELHASAGSTPEIGDEPEVGEPLRIVHFDDAGTRHSSQAVVSEVAARWTRPDHTVAENVLTLEGDTTDSGVLVDPSGSVTGMVIGSADGRSVAYGREELARVVQRLADGGIVERPWIGVRAADHPQSTPDASAAQTSAAPEPGSNAQGGAEVIEVIPGSPAELAGLAPGDVIVSVGTERIVDLDDLVRATATLTPGETVEVEIHRMGVPHHLVVVVAEYSD